MSHNILLGITGGIAAYKIPMIIRLLQKKGYEVKVIMTESAQKFITPLTLQTIAKNKVHTDLFTTDFEPLLEHISLAKWADKILIAPATANTIAKLAAGLADNLLTSVCLASKAKIYLAPAMNQGMWFAEITQENIQKLKARGMIILDPEKGEQACGDSGVGRMVEPKDIVEKILGLDANVDGHLLNIKNKKVLITAGPTVEPIDPVRFISNRSSGKMGYAIAEAFVKAFGDDANVSLISGPTRLPSPTRKIINVNTAKEMLDAVLAKIYDCDIFISCAAVADFKASQVSNAKMKKAGGAQTFKLIPNEDILLKVSSLFKNKVQKPFVVGFAAETENVIDNARKKLLAKKLDMVVANKVDFAMGFDSDENEISIIHKDGQIIDFKRDSKINLAQRLVKTIADFYPAIPANQKISPFGKIQEQ